MKAFNTALQCVIGAVLGVLGSVTIFLLIWAAADSAARLLESALRAGGAS